MGRAQKNVTYFLLGLLTLCTASCVNLNKRIFPKGPKPKAVTHPLPGEADECGIWADTKDPSNSALICNDKSPFGALFVFDLNGKEISRSHHMNRPVGVSVRNGIKMKNGDVIDVVGCGVRGTNEIKIFKMDPKSRELIDVTHTAGISSGFRSDTYGFCLYKRQSDGQLFCFVSTKHTDNIHQFRLDDDGTGRFKGTLVRKFGVTHQRSFVEGMVADDEYGYYYAADERHAILKFQADPDVKKDPFIRAFGLADGIKGDREGLALYKKANGKGYLLVSSQGDSTFKIYERTGNNKFVKSIHAEGVTKTDGIGVTSMQIPPNYPTGVFAAHNDKNNNYAIFDWFEFSGLK
ncbi:phytase [Simkania sp.]|uniref:phytase n=1 Tax=Simkania sp. TaxID=34094 RepID=UPI003B520C71